MQKPKDISVSYNVGHLEVYCPYPPVSLQNDSSAKPELQEKIRAAVSKEDNVFTGALELEIEWYDTPQFFYENGHRADIDNVIKPILDALKGKEGIMVDDTQIERVECLSIMDTDAGAGWFIARVRFPNSDWVKRKHVFIEIDDKWCKPSLERQGQYELGKRLMQDGKEGVRGFSQIDRPLRISQVRAAGFDTKKP